MTPSEPVDLSAWIARIRGREMPVFGRTIEALRAILADERASASALAQVILKDAAMTTKVLRLANSAFFNHAHQGVSTVSRAIVVLGFNPVAEIALSVSLIDSLLSGGVRSRAQTEMARSFHAAVQARWLAHKRGDSHGEEVFIAALVARVGEMAFWCFGGEQAVNLDRCLSQSRGREEEVQQVVLGFPLRLLSVGLVREWKLGALVAAALEGGGRGRGLERAVVLGHQLARAAEEGWESQASRQCLRDVADYLELPVSSIQAEVFANGGEAMRVAASFGAPEAARRIPHSGPALEPTPVEASPVSGPDAQLQLRILHDLAAMTLGRADINDILQMVSEGLFRAVGCERVVLALLSPDRARLKARSALGADELLAHFDFAMEGDPDDVLDAAIDSALAFRLDRKTELPGSLRLRQAVACDEGFLLPFGMRERQIGVFYVDRRGKPMDDEAWRACQHFAMQASLAVGISAGQPQP